MSNILYIHQSAELYGSDKTLLYLVSGIREKGLHPIVVLPSEGPLLDELKHHGIETIIAPVLKISRNMFRPGSLMMLPFQIIKAFQTIRRHLNGREVQLVHSNTLAVLLGALFAKRYRIKHLWHVHEIIEHPKFISNLFPKLVDYFSERAVFNSKATMDFMINKRPRLAPKSVVVLNGMERPQHSTPDPVVVAIRQELFNATAADVVVALVGRISRWKGQQLLLESFNELESAYPNARLVFVGSPPPEQEHFLESLEEKIMAFGLAQKVRIIPFTSDIWKIWDSIDVATVPSTEPEPFGLVALEAMLSGKPVVGAKHGGLTEIITDNETGIFFTPGDKNSLRLSLEALIADPEKRREMGRRGKERAQTHFSQQRYVEDFLRLYR